MGKRGANMPSDEALRCAALIEPHLEALFRAAYRLCRSVPDAEDLVQDVCLRAFDRCAHLRQADSPRAWLLRVLFNLHVDTARRAKRFTAQPFDEARRFGHDAADMPADHAEAALLADTLDEAWRGLNPDQQALLALSAEGHSPAELAAITGLPLGALKARLHRARARLGRLLDRHRQPPLAAYSGESR
jgi:RNA polymerase sigma factor (sigma-70 family)